MEYLCRVLHKTVKFIQFFFYVLWEIVLANLRVAYHVIVPSSVARPGIIAIPLDCTTAVEITALFIIISLTPGTLVLEISSDQKTIFVHAMFIDNIELLKQSIKQQFEKPVLELFQS